MISDKSVARYIQPVTVRTAQYCVVIIVVRYVVKCLQSVTLEDVC